MQLSLCGFGVSSVGLGAIITMAAPSKKQSSRKVFLLYLTSISHKPSVDEADLVVLKDFHAPEAVDFFKILKLLTNSAKLRLIKGKMMGWGENVACGGEKVGECTCIAGRNA